MKPTTHDLENYKKSRYTDSVVSRAIGNKVLNEIEDYCMKTAIGRSFTGLCGGICSHHISPEILFEAIGKNVENIEIAMVNLRKSIWIVSFDYVEDDADKESIKKMGLEDLGDNVYLFSLKRMTTKTEW